VSAERTLLVEALAGVIAALKPGSPTLVAVEGRSAAGKSAFADDLAAAVARGGRPTLRASLDDFHPPGHAPRSSARGYTPESFYAEGYDYARFRAQLVDPLRDGDRRCRRAAWDSARDVPADAEWQEAAEDAIAVVDGAFLFHTSLWGAWDYSIWLEIDFETMVARAAKRDVAWIGSEAETLRRYREFWIPTHRRYEALIGPKARCDVVIDPTDFAAPRLVRGPATPNGDAQK